MEKLFKLKANGTSVRTEILAGLTTFMTMAYIIALNPNLLTNFDVGSSLWNGVFMATCIASAIGMFAMAFLANKPFALAPGMGLNSFFALVVANIAGLTGMTYVESFQSALVIILLEGIIFVALSVLNIREKIVEAIPLGVRLGIGPAIGIMLMNIGLGSNAGIYSENGGPFFVMRDFFGSLTPSVAQTAMGSGYNAMVLTVVTMFVGLFVMVVLAKKGIRAAVLLGMLVASVIYWAGQALFLGMILRLSGHGLLRAALCRHDGDDLLQVQLPGLPGYRLVHGHHPGDHLLHDRYVRYHRYAGGNGFPGRDGGPGGEHAQHEGSPAG